MDNAQQQSVAPPSKEDINNGLPEFASVIQNNFENIFLLAHQHNILSSVPTGRDGKPGDIALVENSTGVFLYVKFVSGWTRFVPA